MLRSWTTLLNKLKISRNELLGQISNILKRAKYINSCELGECEFLIDNTFIVREWSDEEPCIDLERC